MNRRRGSPGNKQSLDQVSNGFHGNVNQALSALVSSSSSSKDRKTRVKSSDFYNRNVYCKVVRSKTSRKGFVLDGSIFFNKEPTSEALVA